MTDVDRDVTLLRYVAESITLIKQYGAPGKDVFRHEPMRQDAVIRTRCCPGGRRKGTDRGSCRLETLADAANQLSAELKARHPEIPWRQVYGFRNVMAHRYLGSINLERGWTTVEQSLPPLEVLGEQELRSLDRNQELE